jgi:hypothetical protein
MYLSTLSYFLNYFRKTGIFVLLGKQRIYSRYKVINICFR